MISESQFIIALFFAAFGFSFLGYGVGFLHGKMTYDR
jgi:hypothetical protein